MFAITRFPYIEVFSICFTITGLKKIVRYTEDFVILVEIRYSETPLYITILFYKIAEIVRVI